MNALESFKTEDLPPIKPVFMRLWQLLNSNSATLNDITETISQDPILTAKIVSIANSPLYKGNQEITALEKALIRLGLNEIKEITYAFTLMDSFEDGQMAKQFSMVKFWKHSLATALALKKMKLYLPQLFTLTEEEQEGMYLTGLMHDIGYLIFASSWPKRYKIMSEIWDSGKRYDPLLVEQKAFGANHAELGAKAAELWNFTEMVQQAISIHHDQPQENDNQLVQALRLADFLATLTGYGFNPLLSKEYKIRTLPKELLKNDFQALMQDVSVQLEIIVSQSMG